MASYQRKIIRIRAQDTPNVRYSLAQKEAGVRVTHETLIPGIITYRKYQQRRIDWDPILQCIGLDGEFYEGADLMLFPPQWLNHSEMIADMLKGRKRDGKAIGCDPGEGVSLTAWSIVDEFGLIEKVSYKTSDTSVIVGQTLALMRKYNIPAESVGFDAGGGGKQHAHYMRSRGHNVRIVPFGAKITSVPKSGMTTIQERRETKEGQAVWLNRRAQMYDTLRDYINPDYERRVLIKDKWVTISGFGIPKEYGRLRKELAPIPLTRDGEGRLYIIPKDKPDKNRNPLDPPKKDTLIGIIGHSPDEADSLVIATYIMTYKQARTMIGASRKGTT